ncbi:MAG: PTS glucitol/sorbitol transporter subunit IIB [Dorea sp.]|jgi:PTS system glucitol/sorbitol-specific IIB component|nr:PTS glucitol/sorbitol transporter subunit IIB [Dorea sp.]
MHPVVKIERGPNGWGGPLLVSETETQHVVASVTGGGIHPLAQKTADLLGVKAVDGFSSKVEPDHIIVAFVDCGGTARCGVYPKMGVKTVDVLPIGPSGPLASFINENNFCSGVTLDTITLAEGQAAANAAEHTAAAQTEPEKTAAPEPASGGAIGIITRMGRAVGSVVQTFNQAARNTLDIVIKNIIPFMMFISVIVGIVNYTGIGTILANLVKPLAGSLPGLIGLSIFCGIPFLSPVLGPGAVIAQIIGVILGNEIGKGVIPVSYALPALFAINSQVGCDFVPVALTLAEADDATTSVGVPAMLFTRLVTGPMAVLIAYFLSFGL